MTTETTPAPKVETPKHLTRTGIMLTIAPAVCAALNAIPEVNAALCGPKSIDKAPLIRRLYRAILTIGIRAALDAGMPKEVLMGEAMVAIKAELTERAIKEKEQGATQAPADA